MLEMYAVRLHEFGVYIAFANRKLLYICRFQAVPKAVKETMVIHRVERFLIPVACNKKTGRTRIEAVLCVVQLPQFMQSTLPPCLSILVRSVPPFRFPSLA